MKQLKIFCHKVGKSWKRTLKLDFYAEFPFDDLMIVDSHCHLDYEALHRSDVVGVIERAADAGVKHFLTIGTELSHAPRVLKIAELFDNVFCTLGTHPLHAHEDGEADYTAADILELSKHPKVVGIGEAGLDYHYSIEYKAVQHHVFQTNITAALAADLPLVIHARDADADVMKIVDAADPQRKLKGVLHCFTASQELADWGIARGLYIGFTGILTYKNAQNVRDVAATVPLDRLLIETDAPYLAPVPHRGKTNEPAYVVEVCKTLAALRGLSFEAMAAQTTENFFSLFTKASPTSA